MDSGGLCCLLQDFPRTLEALRVERDDKRSSVSASVNCRSLGKDARERMRGEMVGVHVTHLSSGSWGRAALLLMMQQDPT